MNIADKLRKVLEIKNNIKAALEEKGIENVSNDFSTFAESIANIKGGGDEPEPEIPKHEDVYAEALASIPELPTYEDVVASIPPLEPWVQPEDWIDLRTVLEDNIIEEYPYRIAMMVEDSESMEFYFHSNSSNNTSNILKPDYILCSNRTDYDSENISQRMVHTWDGEAENGYRWVIFYFKTQSIYFPLEQYKTIQLILDGISVNTYTSLRIPNNNSGIVTISSTIRLNNNIVSIESINGGNIYSKNRRSSYFTDYYSVFENALGLVYIGEGVINESNSKLSGLFRNCISLKYVPSFDISSFGYDKTSCYEMFKNCKSLTHIPELNTSNVTRFDYMFIDCSSLVTIPLIDTSNVTRFDYMFQDCSSLVTIPLIDTSNGTNFNNMFYGCSSLVTIPLINTSNGTSFSSMFNGSTSLVTIPLIDTSNGTSFSNMFSGCSSLVTIPLIDTSNGTSFSNMFYYCYSLITIPELDFSNASSFSSLFADSGLIALPKLNIPLVSGTLDFGTAPIKYIEGINAPLITGFDSSFFSKSVYIGRLDCPKVSKYSFGSKDLKYIEYIDTTSLTDCSNMFSGCSSLTTIPELNTSNCTNFSHMFRDCNSLTTIPELNTSNGTNFKYMFQNCSSLKSIPLIDTTNVTDFSYMFQNCSSLISIPELNTSNGTNFSNIFSYCISLETIPLINTSNGTNFSNMFSHCSSLVTIPELDFSSATKVSNFFEYCYKLEIVPSFYLPKVTNISNFVCYTNNIKKFGDLRFPAVTSISSLFYQSNFKICSEVGVLDSSSYGVIIIPANQELLKKVKVTGVLSQLNFNTNSISSPNYVRDLEVDAIDCDRIEFDNWVALTKQSLLNILNALVPLEGTTRTLTLNKNYHMIKLTDEEIAIATNKGWTISEGTYTLP